MCDLETSRMRRPWPTGGCCAMGRFSWRDSRAEGSVTKIVLLEQEEVGCLSSDALLASIRMSVDHKCSTESHTVDTFLQLYRQNCLNQEIDK